ncbi:MAG: CPBP family intramembrane metalloprotease [Peptococcaceae bacterium]|nr:CPBP family intramembrane metalloprotease [Peptococcaceae bacterium]
MIFWNKYGEIRSGWALAIIVAVYYFIQIVAVIGIGAIAGMTAAASGAGVSGSEEYSQLVSDLLTNTWVEFFMYYEVTLLTIGASLLFFWLLYKKPPARMGLSGERWLSQLLVGCLFGIAAFCAVFGLLLLTQSAAVTGVDWGRVVVPGFIAEVFLGVILFVLVGFSEEILTRGYMMSVMRTTRVKWLIVVLPALLFALMHATNPAVTLLGLGNIMFVGILFAYMVVRTGGLWLPIGFHIAWNFFQGHVFGVAVSGLERSAFMQTVLTGPDWLTGGAFGAEGGILCTLVILLSLVCVRFFTRKPARDFWSQ